VPTTRSFVKSDVGGGGVPAPITGATLTSVAWSTGGAEAVPVDVVAVGPDDVGETGADDVDAGRDVVEEAPVEDPHAASIAAPTAPRDTKPTHANDEATRGRRTARHTSHCGPADDREANIPGNISSSEDPCRQAGGHRGAELGRSLDIGVGECAYHCHRRKR
jgi:hypothetical protein